MGQWPQGQRIRDSRLCPHPAEPGRRKTAADIQARRNDVIRMLGLIGDSYDLRRKVADIHVGDIEAMHLQITEIRGPVRANRVLAIASKAFSLSLKPLAGEKKPWRDAAARCSGVQRNPEKGKERFFLEAEIAAQSDALSEHTTGSAANLHQVHHVHRVPPWGGR